MSPLIPVVVALAVAALFLFVIRAVAPKTRGREEKGDKKKESGNIEEPKPSGGGNTKPANPVLYIVVAVLFFVAMTTLLSIFNGWFNSSRGSGQEVPVATSKAKAVETQPTGIRQFDPAPGGGIDIEIPPGEVIQVNNFGGNNQFHLMILNASGCFSRQINGKGKWTRVCPEEARETRLPRGEIFRFVQISVSEDAPQGVTLRVASHKAH